MARVMHVTKAWLPRSDKDGNLAQRRPEAVGSPYAPYCFRYEDPRSAEARERELGPDGEGERKQRRRPA